jgi:hypothetical protein
MPGLDVKTSENIPHKGASETQIEPVMVRKQNECRQQQCALHRKRNRSGWQRMPSG